MSSPMGLNRDSRDLFRDNRSQVSIFARPRDYSSRYSLSSSTRKRVYIVSPNRVHVAVPNA